MTRRTGDCRRIMLEPPPAVARAGDEGRDGRDQRGGRHPGREAEEEGDHRGEGDERAAEPEDAGDHLHRPPRRFALRLLQLVVVGGVLEIGQIERGGVAHDLELDVDGQPLLQQLLADIAGRLQEAGAEQQERAG